MNKVLNYNIKLQEQPNRVFSKSAPDSKNFAKYSASIDGSEFEEYSFTGTKEQIDAQEKVELDKANFQPKSNNSVTEQTTVVAGLSVTTTKTRQEGEIWSLSVRVANILQTLTPEEEPTEEQQQQQEFKFGSSGNPKLVSTSVSVLQQSILFKEPYKNYGAEELGALKQYINGASPMTPIAKGLDSSGNPINGTLQDILPMNDEVRAAIKNPVYYVPTANITVSYWSSSPVSDFGSIGQQREPSGGNFKPAEGYISVFMGASSSPADGGGYQVQESYSIGQYDPEMLASSSK